MFGKHFYNKNIRNIVVLFGTVFNDITIKRLKADGTTDKQFKVPIAYGPTEKYMAMVDQRLTEPDVLSISSGSDLQDKEAIGITLPRMSFEISAINYDPTRKLQSTKKYKVVHTTDNTKITSVYTPTPYNFDIDLGIMVRNSDDGTQILEQILPFFTPEFQVTMNEMSTLGIKRDIPIVFNGLTTEDSYEGDLLTRRALIHTLTFTVQGHIYGKTGEQNIIREVNVNSGANFDDVKDVNLNVKPNPLTSNPDDDYTYTETITNIT